MKISLLHSISIPFICYTKFICYRFTNRFYIRPQSLWKDFSPLSHIECWSSIFLIRLMLGRRILWYSLVFRLFKYYCVLFSLYTICKGFLFHLYMRFINGHFNTLSTNRFFKTYMQQKIESYLGQSDNGNILLNRLSCSNNWAYLPNSFNIMIAGTENSESGSC